MDIKASDQSEESNIFDKGVFEHAAIGLAYINLTGRFLKSNKALQQHLGYDERAMRTLQLDEIVHPNDSQKLASAIKGLIEHQHTSRAFNCRCFDAKGKICDLRFMLSVMNNEYGSPLYIIAAIEHADSKSGSQSPPNQASFDRKLFESLAQHLPVSVWLASADLKTLHYANQSFFDIWGITPNELTGNVKFNSLDHVHRDDVERVRAHTHECQLNARSWKQNFRIVNRDGSIRFIEEHGTLLRDDHGNANYFLGTQHDITEQVKQTYQLETLNQELQNAYDEVTRLNQYDVLTGAYNRTAVLDHLSNAFYQFTRYEIPSCIIYFDLNNFKDVNDDHGHLAGDLVLKSFVLHLQEQIRQTDILGRMGGDEFLLLFPGATSFNAKQFLKKTQREFKTKINETQTLVLGFCAGISEIDFRITSIDEWLDNADKIMTQQKAKLKNKI